MITDNLRVALYARVSGEQQEKEDTIASQLEAVTQRIATDGWDCEPELHFVDDGVSGYILARPALERLRDQAAAGAIDRLYMLAPARPYPDADWQIGLGSRDGLVDPQEPCLQGDRGLRQDALR